MSASVLNKATNHLLQLSKEELADAIRYFNLGDYDRSFRSLRHSIETSRRMLRNGTPQEIFTDPGMTPYRIDDQFEATAELLNALENEDDKLDLLCAFLDDSGLEAMSGAQTRYRLYLYRQMLLSFVAGLDNRCVSAEEAAADPDTLERFLNLKFALAAYLESLIAYQQWCLDFVERNGLSHPTPRTDNLDTTNRHASLAM